MSLALPLRNDGRSRVGSRRHRSTVSAGSSSDATIATAQDLRRSLSSSVAHQIGLRGVRRLETRRAMEESHFLAQKARSKPLNPPVDYRSLDYVTEPDENLVCAICRCPFVDPVVLPDCDHCFCRECIRQSWTTPHPLGPRGDCPSCRTPGKLGPRSATSKIIVNILDDLEVHCPKKEEGCAAKLKRGEVQDHITLYCGYGMTECLGKNCDLPVLRKDSTDGCLHFGVCCIDCRQSMLMSNLEQHWKQECPDRKVHCGMCRMDVNYRDLQHHSRESCPAISVPCPGHEFGCPSRFKKNQAEKHTRECPLAKLAPFMSAQKQRMDEQEVAQRQMSRKLELLEEGFINIQRLLDERADDPDSASADESRIPLLSGPYDSRENSIAVARSDMLLDDLSLPSPPLNEDVTEDRSWTARHLSAEQRRTRFRRQHTDENEAFPSFHEQSLPPPVDNGPYSSPIHHLLSMHESLRNEVVRISTAVQELDGRLSMQTLNENLRTREELAYLTGQVAGMSRQVHWLTSAQLQTQQGRTGGGAGGRGADFSDLAGAGVGVEAAVNAVGNAVRGAARMVGGGGSSTGAGVREGLMRRGTSEEGRTKL